MVLIAVAGDVALIAAIGVAILLALGVALGYVLGKRDGIEEQWHEDQDR